MSAEQTHYRTCHLCEAMCGLKIETNGEEVLRISGDKNDVHSKGHICPKGVALQDLHNDPDRLKYPVRKTKDGWEQISWEAAYEEVAQRINEIRSKHGNDAVGFYMGNPAIHNTGTALYYTDFAKALGTRNRFASHSLDQLPQMFVSGEMFGHHALFAVPDIDRTQHMLIIGGNPLVSNGSIMSTPDVKGKLQAIQQRGGKVVVIDPRRTRTAEVSDQHYFIKPGTDVLLLLAMVNTIFSEALVDDYHVMRHVKGMDKLREVVSDYSPEFAAEFTGISAGQIRQITRELCEAESGVCYGRLGVSVQEYGSLCQWLINVINILSGNMDVEGGVMFTTPAIDFIALLKHEAKAFRWKSRVKGFPEIVSEFPSTTMADEMLTPGQGQIKAMITLAGNPVISAPDADRMEEAFAGLDFMVAIDIYCNETTRHADIILPPATALEVMHYDFVLNIVATRNVANYSAPVFQIDKNQRYDWQILFELQKRLASSALQKIKAVLMGRISPETRLDLGLKVGPFGWRSKEKLSLKKLKAKPHGIDLGALTSRLPERLFTADKKIDLVPERVVSDMQRVQGLQKPAANSFLLIGRRHLRSNNSWLHNSERLMKGNSRFTLHIHPDDAATLDVQNGQDLEVRGPGGSVSVPVEITDTIMPGVVSVPHGWGHQKASLTVAKRDPGSNINKVLSTDTTDQPTGNAVFNGVEVQLAQVEKDQVA